MRQLRRTVPLETVRVDLPGGDTVTVPALSGYKGLDPRWHDWSAVVEACRGLADAVLDLQG